MAIGISPIPNRTRFQFSLRAALMVWLTLSLFTAAFRIQLLEFFTGPPDYDQEKRPGSVYIELYNPFSQHRNELLELLNCDPAGKCFLDPNEAWGSAVSDVDYSNFFEITEPLKYVPQPDK